MAEPELGTTSLGTEYLSVNIEYSGLNPIQATGSTSTLSGDSIATRPPKPIQAESELFLGGSVILNPRNLQTKFDTERDAFVSEWFEERTPIPDTEEYDVVVTADVTDDQPVSVTVERDDTGNGIPDATSDLYETGEGVVTPLLLDGVDGSRYRVVFPEYDRDDVVDSVSVALSWENNESLEDNWPIRGIELRDGFLGDILTTYASELYRFDSRLDEAYDNRFLSTASGPILDTLAAPVNVNRQPAEQDNSLRYRLGVEYAIFASDGTLSSIATVIDRLVDDPSTVDIGVKSGVPVLTVTIPEDQLATSYYTASEIQQKLIEATSVGFSVDVTILVEDGTLSTDSTYTATETTVVSGESTLTITETTDVSGTTTVEN